MDLLARLHGLDCADGKRPCDGSCEDMAGEYLGEQWPRCPIAEIGRDQALQEVLTLRRQAAMSPIDGFPECLAAWVTTIWDEVNAAFDSRRVEQAEVPNG